MKKISLFVVVLLMIGTFSFGFDFSFGVKAGGGYAGFLGKDYSDYLDSWDSKRALFLGYGGGIFATLGLTDLIAIQPEIMLLRVGGADKDSFGDKYYFSSHHLTPAILIIARFGIINVLAGPMVMFKMGTGKYVEEDSGGSVYEYDLGNDELYSYILAATVGIGIQYPLAFGSFIAEVRGFYSITSWSTEYAVFSSEWNPFAVMVMIGYSFPILK